MATAVRTMENAIYTNQMSNVAPFVERMAKNNRRNNGNRNKIHKIFLLNCFVFVITVV